MTRGEIWWIDFGLAYGSTPQGRRPAIIVQNDNFNASRILTTVVVPLTTNTMLAEHKNNIFLDKSITNLPKDSVALTPQVGVVDKKCLNGVFWGMFKTILQNLYSGDLAV